MFIRVVLFLCLSISSLFSALILTDSQSKYAGFTLSYLYDENSSLGIEEVTHNPLFQNIPSQFTMGYKTGTAWFRLTLRNQSSHHRFVLHFTEPFWKTFNLYEPTPRGWNLQKNGLLTPLKERRIEDASPSFEIEIQPGESKTYYLQGETTNGQIGALELYTEKEFYRPSRLTLKVFYPFYTGILFIIVTLNLFLLIEMRERLYAYYIGYVSSFIVFVSMFSGSYLCLGFKPWNEGLHVVGTVVLAFMALFSGVFLELATYFPIMNRLFKVFTAVFLMSGVLISFDIPYVTHMFNILSSVFVTLLLILAIQTWIIGKIQTRYYLAALIVYMPAMGLMVLTFNALIPNTDISRYAFLFGALVEIIFFALILASRFHTAKNEKIHYQKELLAEKRKNLERLQKEVALQRQEIQDKNAILFHQSRHAAMGEMITMIAHQWRQPLNTLALINQDLYIKYKLGRCDEANFEESHKKFNEHLQYMSKTIDDFRNYYKNDTVKHPENLREIAELALRLSDVFLNYAKIKTELIVTCDQKVLVAKNEMIQVLMNLIKNAHDAILEKNIPSGQITLTIEETQNSIQIRVCDNGGGVPKNIGNKIFEPYFSTKSENGTGLGLYMSKSIVEDHCGGRLTFFNTNSGTCFTISLPSLQENQT